MLSIFQACDAIGPVSTSGYMTHPLEVSLPDRHRQLIQTQIAAKSDGAAVILQFYVT